jgi:hypothetical protein
LHGKPLYTDISDKAIWATGYFTHTNMGLFWAVSRTTVGGIVLSASLAETLGEDDGDNEDALTSNGCANAAHLDKVLLASTKVKRIERLSSDTAADIQTQAFALYEASFPSEDEREPVDLIKTRIEEKTFDFHAHAYLDEADKVVGYCQGSIVKTANPVAQVFFSLQYCCVDISFRGGGIMQLMHAVNCATLVACAKKLGCDPLGVIWETEPAGLGEDDESRKFTKSRLIIHNKAGGRVLIGKRADGSYVNLHVQPRLTPESSPITLHITAQAIMDGFLANFTAEGFAQADVDDAQQDVNRRFRESVSCWLLPCNLVPNAVELARTGDDLLRRHLLDMYKVSNLEEVPP